MISMPFHHEPEAGLTTCDCDRCAVSLSRRQALAATAMGMIAFLGALYAPLRPAIERAGPDLTATIKANAQIQADLLRAASPAIGALVAGGKMKVIASYYELASGKVTLLG